MNDRPGAGRLPDFLIVGAMKAGTSSLYRWLGLSDDVWLPAVKEPHFFSRDAAWARGLDWYRGLFDGASADQLVGEGSTSYTSGSSADVAARRIAAAVPSARIVYLVRDPVERARSHYRMDVRRGRVRRPLADALAEPGNEYVARSQYFSRLRPYLAAFPREQICVVRFEDLAAGEEAGWQTALRHLGLPYRPKPAVVFNVTAEKRQYRRAAHWMWTASWLEPVRKGPRPIRRLGHHLATRGGDAYERELEASLAPLPSTVTGPLWDEADRLAECLGHREPLWARDVPHSTHA